MKPEEHYLRLRREGLDRLLELFKPDTAVDEVVCVCCARGPCKIERGGYGRCGSSFEAACARMQLLFNAIGASTHAASASYLLSKASDGPAPRKLGLVARALLEFRPKSINDYRRISQWLNDAAAWVISCAHFGQEASFEELVKQALYAGLLDLIALEVAEAASTAIAGEPKVNRVEHKAPPRGKPVILVVGHHSPVLVELSKRINDDVVVAAVCCSAHEAARCFDKVYFVGSLAEQLKAIGAGLADVVIVDEQCVLPGLLDVAKLAGSLVISCNAKVSLGLPDATELSLDDACKVALENGGCLIANPSKAAEVAVKVAPIAHHRRSYDPRNFADKCALCGACERACPYGVPLTTIISKVKKNESIEACLAEHCASCLSCVRACPTGLNPFAVLSYAYMKAKAPATIPPGVSSIEWDDIVDAAPLYVLGKSPGVALVTGCPEPPSGKSSDVALVAEELLKRRFTVLTAGCSASIIASAGLYDKYSQSFTPRGLINLGSCFANVGAAEALIVLASRWSGVTEPSYDVVVDYSVCRIPAVGVVLGALTPKSSAIAWGFAALGVPVVLPDKPAFRVSLEARGAWKLYDYRSRGMIEVSPAPRFLVAKAKTAEEALKLAVEGTLRVNDSASARRTKLKILEELGIRVEPYVRTSWDYVKPLEPRAKPSYAPDASLRTP